MTTLLGEKLTEAIDKKSSDVTSFLWKGVKTLNAEGKYVQNEQRLVDMTEYDLNVCYDHCKKMLHNKDSKNPGRYIVLDIISEQKDKCGTELFLRYLEQTHGRSRFQFMGNINEFLGLNKEYYEQIEKKAVLSDMLTGVPNEFESLEVHLVMDGCIDKLGTFNKKHITRTFVLKQGIWLTTTESKDLDISERSNKLEVIREHLNLKDIEKLYINSKGINYTQMRAMLGLKPNKKYIDLTTNQLETLRNRILFSLEQTVKNHIYSWEKRMKEIEQVAEHNQYKI